MGVTAADAPRSDALAWPAAPWECAAAESHVLLHFDATRGGSGAGKHAKQALKLGLLELTARRRLRAETVRVKRMFGRWGTKTVFVRGEGDGKPLPQTLPHLLAALGEEPAREYELADGSGRRVWGVEPTALVRRIVQRSGGNVRGYVSDVLRPALEGRGWVSRERRRVLGIFPARRWVLTRDGMEAQQDLLWRVEYGNRQMGRLVSEDPARALAFVGLSSAALLLMSDALPHVRRLREVIDEEERRLAPDSAMGMNFAAADGATNLDLSALDSIDAAMDAVDSGVDAGAGSDGGSGDGGDGGGGDGGGGGGGE